MLHDHTLGTPQFHILVLLHDHNLDMPHYTPHAQSEGGYLRIFVCGALGKLLPSGGTANKP